MKLVDADAKEKYLLDGRYWIEPTKHGRWIYEGHTGEPSEPFFSCSACRYVHYKASNYCPYCGARMDAQIGEDKSHPFAESVMMGMDGSENG